MRRWCLNTSQAQQLFSGLDRSPFALLSKCSLAIRMLPPLDPASLVEWPQNMRVTALNKPNRDRAISVAVLRQFLPPVSLHPDMMRWYSDDRVVEGHKISWKRNNPLRGKQIWGQRVATKLSAQCGEAVYLVDHHVSQESDDHAPLEIFLRPEHSREAEIPPRRLIMSFVEEWRHGWAVDHRQFEDIGPDKEEDRIPAEKKPHIS